MALRSRTTECNVLVSALMVLCWTMVILRVYVRTFMAKCFGVDDWLLLVALGMFTVQCSAALLAVHYGVGRDKSLIRFSDLPYAIFYWWLGLLFYNPATLFVRLSISVFIYKLCTSRTHKNIIWVTIILSGVFSAFYFFFTLFHCTPPWHFWKQWTGKSKGVCMQLTSISAASYAHSVMSSMADWVLGLLPIWLIWGLQMDRRTKISVGILLGLGVLAGVAAMIRIPFIGTSGENTDVLYNIVSVSIWSMVEAAIGITAASASALRPLFKKFYAIYATVNTQSRSRSKSQTQVPLSTRDYQRSTHTTRGKTFYVADDSSVELGLRGSGNAAVLYGTDPHEETKEGRGGIEERLTRKGLGSIHVRTVIDVKRERERGKREGSYFDG